MYLSSADNTRVLRHDRARQACYLASKGYEGGVGDHGEGLGVLRFGSALVLS